MATTVTLIDYGLGNLFSIGRALTYLGARVEVASEPDALERPRGMVLPGVGAFGDGMRQLKARGLVEPLRNAARAGRPLLGICLGMQLLFQDSEEFGVYEGLGLLAGRVRRLRETGVDGRRVKVPHIGWSALQATEGVGGWDRTVLDGLAEGECMYFVHSYVPVPEGGVATLAQMRYGGHAYAAVVTEGHVTGFQFHPEKSGEAGLMLLRNFVQSIGAS